MTDQEDRADLLLALGGVVFVFAMTIALIYAFEIVEVLR